MTFDEHTSSDDMIKVLQASLAYPGVFTPIEAFDSMWFSMLWLSYNNLAGSSIYETDVISPILHCEMLGYKEEDIIIDVVLGGNPKLSSVMAQYYNSIKMAQRTLEIMNYYEVMFGLLRAKQGHPGVHFRYVIGPTISV